MTKNTQKMNGTPTAKPSSEADCYVPIVDMVTVNWFEIDKVGLPSQNKDEFYGDRYSIPVLLANAYTGQVEPRTAIYDFRDKGWCLCGLNDGPSCFDYEILIPTHYCLIPPFAV